MIKLCATVRLTASALTSLKNKVRLPVWVNGSLVGEGVKGLHTEGYSVHCVLDARDSIPLKEMLNILSAYRG